MSNLAAREEAARRGAASVQMGALPPDIDVSANKARDWAEAIARARYQPYLGTRQAKLPSEFIPAHIASGKKQLYKQREAINKLQRELEVNEAQHTAKPDAALAKTIAAQKTQLLRYQAHERGYKQQAKELKYGPGYSKAKNEYTKALGMYNLLGDDERKAKLQEAEAALKGFSPKSVEDLVRGSQGAYREPLQEAQNMTKAGAGTFPYHASQYMNPYKQEVLDRIGEEGGRFLNEKIMPALTSQFVRQGISGGNKHRQAVERASRDLMGEVSAKQKQALAEGYQQAGQLFNSDQARQLQAARGVADIAQAGQQMGAADIAQLSNLGTLKQQQAQTGKDIAYNDFRRQQAEPERKMAFLSQALHDVPMPTMIGQQEQNLGVPNAGGAANIAGAAGNLLAMRQMAFGRGAKRGGAIRNSMPHKLSPAHLKFLMGRGHE